MLLWWVDQETCADGWKVHSFQEEYIGINIISAIFSWLWLSITVMTAYKLMLIKLHNYYYRL